MASRRDAESLLVAVNDREQLHLRHFPGGTRHTTVVLLHGLCGDGSLYSRDADSLASCLVRDGFDVWVPDLRGHGRSFPALAPGDEHGFHAAVVEDLATVMGELREKAPENPLYLVGHGTGGLLWLSFLARWPIVREMVRGIVLVGSGAHLEPGASWSWQLRYGWWADWLAMRGKIIPGTALNLGPGVESVRFYREIRRMLASASWLDPEDGLDHAAQLRELPDWPPTLILAAEADAPWSGPHSARTLQGILPSHDGRLYVFPRTTGVRLLGPKGALAGGPGGREVESLVLDWLAAFDG